MGIRKWIYTAPLLIGLAALMPEFLRNRQSGAFGAETAAASKENAISTEDEDIPRFVIRSDVNMVSVPVTVRKADGSFFKGLTQKSFRVLEDGKEQEIVLFAEEGLPTHIAIVLDVSGSVQPEWGIIKYATKRFLENLRPDDDFSLTTFNDEVRVKVGWGRNTGAVDAKLSEIYCKDNTKLWDAIHLVSTGVFKGLDGKKVMIIMSDGMDNQSYYSYADAVRAAVENNISIYIVNEAEALRQTLEYRYPDLPSRILSYFAQADSILRRLAYDTGGRVLRPNSFGQLDDIYADVVDELRNQYTLGYISTNTAKDGTYRAISVRVSNQDARNVTITARPGYYAPRK